MVTILYILAAIVAFSAVFCFCLSMAIRESASLTKEEWQCRDRLDRAGKATYNRLYGDM